MKFLENINNRDKRVNSMINNPGMINFKANPEVVLQILMALIFTDPSPHHLEYTWLPC